MSRLTLKSIILTSLVGLLPISYVYAHNLLDTRPKVSIIRVTSTDLNQPTIAFDGAMLSSSRHKQATITEIHATTPWEMTVSSEHVRYILKTDLQNPMLQVQAIERTDHGDVARITSAGHVFDGIESNCDEVGCVTSAMDVLN